MTSKVVEIKFFGINWMLGASFKDDQIEIDGYAINVKPKEDIADVIIEARFARMALSREMPKRGLLGKSLWDRLVFASEGLAT